MDEENASYAIESLTGRMQHGRKEPVNLIVGTDWGADVDDVAAMRVFCYGHRAGLCRLLGIGLDTRYDHAAASLHAFLCAERVNCPIGIDPKGPLGTGRYQAELARNADPYLLNQHCPDAVRLYRQILAQAPAPVEICEIGFPTIPADLILSEPDELSPLSGKELVLQKVKKLWMMAGNFEHPEEGGMEFNLSENERAKQAGNLLCEHWPTPITFLGFEVGRSVITGIPLLASYREGKRSDDMVARAFHSYGALDGRCSWDPMLALLALYGEEESAGYTTVSGKVTVDPVTGQNRFQAIDGNAGPHCFVQKRYEDTYYRDEIDAILLSGVEERPDECSQI